jgi:thioredoxin reductase-like selenoprotein T
VVIFLLTNSAESFISTTGAFEIFYNDIQIWSTLSSKRLPKLQEIIEILEINLIKKN